MECDSQYSERKSTDSSEIKNGKRLKILSNNVRHEYSRVVSDKHAPFGPALSEIIDRQLFGIMGQQPIQKVCKRSIDFSWRTTKAGVNPVVVPPRSRSALYIFISCVYI